MLNKYGPIESFPESALAGTRDRALLFKTLATLRTAAPLFSNVDEMEWKGPTPAFPDWATRIDDKRLLARAEGALAKRDKQPASAPGDAKTVNEAAPPS
jgi:hypothetical protein